MTVTKIVLRDDLTIVTFCFDQDRGSYVAYVEDKPGLFSISHYNESEAIGLLINRLAIKKDEYRMEDNKE